jgi:hypothetical protein
MGLAVHDGTLYFTDFSTDWLRYAHLDGSGAGNLVRLERFVDSGQPSGSGQNVVVDSDNGYLYWLGRDDRFQRSRLDGSGVEVLFELPDVHNFGLDVATGKIYFVRTYTIGRINLDGTGLETIVTIPVTASMSNIALDLEGGYIFISASDRINRVSLNGGVPELVARGSWFANRVAVDGAAGMVYWTTTSGEIMRARRDGSEVETVFAGALARAIQLTVVSAVGTSVAREERPEGLRLEGNYPNPFRAGTTIVYHLPEPGAVTLTVFDVLGRSVAVPVGQTARDGGRHEIDFEGLVLPAGTYFYRLESGGRTATGRMSLVR